ncbi:hypothetical protein FOC84_32820 [Achromobacter pestifer]|uniref:Uncharacterized protein n=1 Tax=Achromobacter pestifer TaxID=1353889 RepID=A0A7D4EBX0_9BURK|nr:hypothetical protein [Achromobacter pestifer]QKH39466.1 hypothetical protein FOC84_32820 [Achromobacter pestifer]
MDIAASTLVPDRGDDAQYLQHALEQLSPLRLFDELMIGITRNAPREHAGQRAQPLILSTARSIGATAEEIAVMDAQADARQALLEANPAFQASLARLSAAGITWEWGQECEYGYRSRCPSLFSPPQAISRIEEMAANDAGLDTAQEKQDAADIYRRWLLQNYHPDWKQYQQKWPTLYANPHCARRNDFGLDPNPIEP